MRSLGDSELGLAWPELLLDGRGSVPYALAVVPAGLESGRMVRMARLVRWVGSATVGLCRSLSDVGSVVCDGTGKRLRDLGQRGSTWVAALVLAADWLVCRCIQFWTIRLYFCLPSQAAGTKTYGARAGRGSRNPTCPPIGNPVARLLPLQRFL